MLLVVVAILVVAVGGKCDETIGWVCVCVGWWRVVVLSSSMLEEEPVYA